MQNIIAAPLNVNQKVDDLEPDVQQSVVAGEAQDGHLEVQADTSLALPKNPRNSIESGIPDEILADGTFSSGAGGREGRKVKELDLDQAARHLELLASLDRAETFWFETRDDLEGSQKRDHLQTLRPGRLDRVAPRLARMNGQGAGVFVAVNPVDGGRRKKAYVTTIRAVWGEFDAGLPGAFPIEPTFMVESSPGRFHAYWVCGGLTVDEFDGVMARLVAHYGSDSNAKDRTRILRLAGTWHQKDPANPWLVRITAASGKTYSRDDILAAFPPIERRQPVIGLVKTLEQSSNELAAKLAQIREMLAHVPADLDYETWLRIGAAIHHETGGSALGLELFDEWSRKAPDKYDPSGDYSPATKWSTFGSYTDEPAAMGTLVHIAKQHGWKSREERVSEEVSRLAALNPVIYDQERKAAAYNLRCRVETLDRLVANKRGELEAETNGPMFEPIEPWPEAVAGAELLDELTKTIRRYVVLPDHAAEATALWCLLAHAHDAAWISPILALQSPEKRCGKTTLLLTVKSLVPKPASGSNMTPAVLFRLVHAHSPTLLLDEADTFITDENSELRGALNAGHNRGEATIWRCVGDSHELQGFKVWCPKVIAGIGDLPDTLQDRSIRVPLKRKTSDETVERLLQHDIAAFADLRRKAARWAADNLEAIREHNPAIPDGLNDRAADNWRTMLTIADLAGRSWPEKARRAAAAISGENEDSTQTWKVQLLGDIRAAFDTLPNGPHDRMASEKLAEVLTWLPDRNYGSWGKTGKPISTKAIANAVKGFGIKPRRVETGSAYIRADLEDAWRRYLPADNSLPPAPPDNLPSARNQEKDAQNQSFVSKSTNASEVPPGTSKVSAGPAWRKPDPKLLDRLKKPF